MCSSRWDFMTSNGQTVSGHPTSGGVVNRGHLQSRIQSKLKKQLQLHKEQLTQLQVSYKVWVKYCWDSSGQAPYRHTE